MANNRWTVTNMECVQNLLIERIAMGHPGMLALMLYPAFNDERFYYPAWFGDVLPDVPADRAVAMARHSKIAKGGNESRLLIQGDPIFDFHQHRTAIIGKRNGYNSLCPMIRRAQVRNRIVRQPPAQRRKHRQSLANSGNCERFGDAGVAGKRAPQDAAPSHRPLKDQ